MVRREPRALIRESLAGLSLPPDIDGQEIAPADAGEGSFEEIISLTGHSDNLDEHSDF